jgi:hypothetical protein
VRVNEELLGRKVAAQKTEINDRRGSAALTRDTPLFTKVGTKFRRQEAVAQSVGIFRLRTKGHGVCLSVLWWSEFLVTDPEDPGSIPGTTRFSVKW